MFRMYLEELEEIPDYTKAEQDDMYKKLLAGEGAKICALDTFVAIMSGPVSYTHLRIPAVLRQIF